MVNLDYLKELLIISIILSAFSCTFVQKTKGMLRKSKYVCIYSLIINILFGIIFCMSFTTIKFPDSIWIGLFSFLGADSVYKTLDKKLLSYSDISKRKKEKSTKN